MAENSSIDAAQIIREIESLSRRHQAAADMLAKRRHCVASNFHTHTAEVLRNAGRLLDGRTWDQMPGVQHG